MSTNDIGTLVVGLPEVAKWPEMSGLFERAGSRPRPDWDLPRLACQAVGGEPSRAAPGAAAIACMQTSIILVDDMLDEDPRGEHLRIGDGSASNLAFAFQATAFRLIEGAQVGAERRAAVTSALSWLALTTARGQFLDTENLPGEDDYWKVVQAKSTPFYGAALHIGAILGGADPPVALSMRDFGVILGEVIQIRDDLFDAFEAPASPDWRQGRNNLPILYARTATHTERDLFIDLLPHSDDPKMLAEAQAILIRSGAVSYCAHQLATRQHMASRLLDELQLANAAPMTELLGQQTELLGKLLQMGGPDTDSERPPQARQ